jgi:predicted translation initiation factor SUI1
MPAAKRQILFLAADDRGRAAETAFNAVATRLGLPWVAVARGPAVAEADFASAARVIAVDRAQLEPAVRQRFPTQADGIEYWQLPAGDAAAVEREVMALVTRLLGGRTDVVVPDPPPKPEPPKKVLTAKVGRETAGRKGKGVTTVFDLPLSETELLELAAKLKQRCGTGGTVKDRRIEIQGDNRDRVIAELEKLGFRTRRAGG